MKRALLHTIKEAVCFLLFPPSCPACGRAIGKNEIFCPACSKTIERPDREKLCPRCGKEKCLCGELDPAFSHVYPATFYLGSIVTAIHNLKFNHQPGHAKTLAPLLLTTLRQYCPQNEHDLLAAAPISKKRLRKRGYNQAALLAKELSHLCEIPFAPDALIKTRETKAQHDLSAKDRRTNLADSFQASPIVAGKRVLLIDDVFTTGSTANEAAKTLLVAGAEKVDVLVLASTRDHT